MKIITGPPSEYTPAWTGKQSHGAPCQVKTQILRGHGSRVERGAFVPALAIDPTLPITLYAGTNCGVFKSTDGGG